MSAPKVALTRRRPVICLGAWLFQPSLAATLATVGVLPILLGLGFWQLERAAEKQGVLDTLAVRSRAPAVAWDGVRTLNPEADEFRRLRVTGRYRPDLTLLLDNRVQRGRVGYDVYTPLVVASGDWLLVNRGWVPGGYDRAQLPQVDTPPGRVTVQGQLRRPPGTGLVLREEVWRDWPVRVQRLDLPALSSLSGTALQPVVLLLDSADQVQQAADWPAVNMPPARHRAYAVQWFAMAAALLTLYLYASIRRTSKSREEQ